LSTNDLLLGLGLVVVVALGCRLVADRTGLPAIVLLLPAGFAAGAATSDVHPDVLFGNTFQPLVSLGVGLILFEAGLRLRLHELKGGARPVVIRLILIGVPITAVGIAVAVKLIFGLDWGVAGVLGAILVVSGPTVVLPLLAFVRPSDRVRSVLKFEGVLIDPIGALLGVVAFQAARAGAGGQQPFHFGSMLLSLGAGLVVGVLGAALLLALLRGFQRHAPGQGIAATLMVVVAALVLSDLLREDSGFVATTIMGAVLANQRRVEIAGILEFQGRVVELLIAILFVLISASVTPSQALDLLPRALLLVAVMALVLRPLVVALSTARTALRLPERALVAWLAPRGIVAAATASAFGLQLAQAGVQGAQDILPIAFLAVFGTVVLYGLTAAPVARTLRLAGAGSDVVLVVGGHVVARAIARALADVGLHVRLGSGRADERVAARAAGLDAEEARLGDGAQRGEEELEDVSDALLLTSSDDFNALAAFELRRELGTDHVYRLPPVESVLDLVPTGARGDTVFTPDLTYAELTRRFEDGARLVAVPEPAEGMVALFVVTAQRELRVVGSERLSRASVGATTICLSRR
jgi:NhaP-type Na+/H+ or K+/H+ antiporter